VSAPDGPLFGPEAVVRRVDAEAALLLGGGRALLMQLAHPLVARGVAEHSDFAENPFARLQRTLDATYTMVFGTADQARADIQRFREELGTDYLDTLLMHCMTKGTWPSDFRPVMDVLSEAKAKNWVRAVGVSCHGMDPLRAATRCDWIDVDLARINPVGVAARMDSTPDEVVPCLRAMHDAGKGIIGMKILGEGTFKAREERLKSLRFVLGLGCVDAFCIGFEKPEQIDEITRLIEEALRG